MEELYGAKAIRCPHCNIVAQQEWYQVKFTERLVEGDYYNNPQLDSYYEVIEGTGAFVYGESIVRENKILAFCMCHSCENYSLWANRKLVHPPKSIVKRPSEFMPDDVKEVYQEASSVFEHSPRAASALLRLALERLLPQVGAEKDSINNMIAQLAREKKIMKKTKEAMDSLRIIGNDAVHVGEMIFDKDRDEKKVALSLFRLLNRIVNETIESENELQEIYNGLPENKLNGIKQRDKE